MATQRQEGFQKPIDDGKRKDVRLAIIRTGQTDGGVEFSSCSCGQPFSQRRDKVREKAIDAHIKKKHGGRAVWL